MRIMKNNLSIVSSFVSTNSIYQGESVPTFWGNLCEEWAEIQFAYKNFIS